MPKRVPTGIVHPVDGVVLPRSFYDRSVHLVAVDLLNKVLVGPGGAAGRIVEVEAYTGPLDPGSHGYRGRTPRTRVMFGAPGHLYVYFTYGMHWCANVVCEPEGDCAAVLVRAVHPVAGLDAMRDRRTKARREVDLTNGPAKACAALGIGAEHYGVDLCDAASPVLVLDDGVPPPAPGTWDQTVRVGLSAGGDLPWRYLVAGDPYVSRAPGPVPRLATGSALDGRIGR